MRLSILYLLILLLSLSFVTVKQSMMIILFTHTISLLSFAYFLVQLTCLLNTRLPFKLRKYDLFLPKIEYLGHDLTVDKNYPVKSKFQLIEQRHLHLILYLFSLYNNNNANQIVSQYN